MVRESKGNTMRTFLALIVMLIMVAGCLPKGATTSEKVIFTTVRSLQAAKELRVTALKTIGGLYINGTLTDQAFKEEVIKIGDQLQKAINITSEAILTYNNAKDDLSKGDLGAKILIYQNILGEFTDLVMPYVLEHVVK